jgi:hypothetical protein
MSTRIIQLMLAVLLTSGAVPALAACYYQEANADDGMKVVSIVLLIGGLIWAVTGSASKAGDQQEGQQSDVPEIASQRFDQEAAATRALTRATEAETDLKRSQVDNARAWAEYEELEELIKHDTRARQLGKKVSASGR